MIYRATMDLFLVVLCALLSVASSFDFDISKFLSNGSVPLDSQLGQHKSSLQAQAIDGRSRLPFNSLMKRQDYCLDSGYLPCPNVAGKCCPAEDNCFPVGCCNTGYIPCGTSRCYDPNISKCCVTGAICTLGYDCVPGGCCPSGYKACGAEGCYDPATEVCCSNGRTCDTGYDCVPGGCCPSGEIQCGANKCYNPRTQKCCIGGGVAWGCSSNENCCTLGGATACVDPSIDQCCPGGTCSKTRTCCGVECCGSSSTCGADGFCTLIPEPSTTTTLSISQPSATAETVPNAPNPNPQNIVFRYDPNRRVRAKDGKLYDAQNKAILENMCEAINAFLGYVSQEIDLTRASDSERRQNRRSMCPPGWCADALKEYLAKYYPDGLPPEAQEAVTMAQDMSCDEFPFAISREGGDTSTGRRICVPGPENSWQGGVMGNYFKGSGIAVGDTFKVTIEGFDCETLLPDLSIGGIETRDFNTTTVENDAFWKGYDSTDPTKNLIVMPLGDLEAGSHTVDLNVSSGSTSIDFSVLTYDGRTISSSTSSDGTIYFSLLDPEDAVSVVGVTTSTSPIEISYSAREEAGASGQTGSATNVRPFFGWCLAIAGAATMIMLR